MIIDAMVINNPMVVKSLSLFCKIKSGIAIWKCVRFVRASPGF